MPALVAGIHVGTLRDGLRTGALRPGVEDRDKPSHDGIGRCTASTALSVMPALVAGIHVATFQERFRK